MLSIDKTENVWALKGPMTINFVEGMLTAEHAFAADRAITVDLSAVTEVDTASLSLMMEWLRRAETAKAKLRFTALPDNLIALANLYQVLDVIQSPE